MQKKLKSMKFNGFEGFTYLDLSDHNVSQHKHRRLIMSRRNTIQAQLRGRIFSATFTKKDGTTRRAYGQMVQDDRLEALPDMITFVDFTVGGIRRMDLSNGPWQIKSGKTLLEGRMCDCGKPAVTDYSYTGVYGHAVNRCIDCGQDAEYAACS